MTVPIALTIAGSDSGGGAGVQGDLKTFEAFGVFGTSVITALTAQNTRGVASVHEVSAAVVTTQLDAVLEDLPPQAVKVGMLTSVPVIRAVAGRLSSVSAPIVVDPVTGSTSGTRFLRAAALPVFLRELLPLASLLTPNLPELEALTGLPVDGEGQMKAAALKIQSLGARAVLVKGGHGTGATIVNGLLDGRTWTRFPVPRVESTSTHGTGCALSSAIAALMARGETLPDAVEKAIAYVRRAIERAPGLGSGRGPLGHRAAGGTSA